MLCDNVNGLFGMWKCRSPSINETKWTTAPLDRTLRRHSQLTVSVLKRCSNIRSREVPFSAVLERPQETRATVTYRRH